MTRKLELEIPDGAWRRLENVAAVLGMRPDAVVRMVLEHLDNGILRPGSWERSHAEDLFGEDPVEYAWECELKASQLGT
jgi:hypothetical protein